jgi:hypothetical protein
MTSGLQLPREFSSAVFCTTAQPIPGTPCMHLLDDIVSAWKPSRRALIGMAPNEATVSISSPFVCLRQTSAIASIGFRTPVLVSQCTTNTGVIAGSARIAASNCSAVGGVKGGVRMTA